MSDLEIRLRELGATLTAPPPPADLAEQVLRRLGPERVRRRRRPTRRLVAAVVAALIIALALTPPVRAAVLHWLRIGGVVIRTVPSPATSVPPASPPSSAAPWPGGPVASVDEARRLVAFEVGVPSALGSPESVAVSDDRRVVSMEWSIGRGRLHLDQFDGTMSWAFVKRSWDQLTIVQVDGRDAVWLARAHQVVYVDRDGMERTETARIAGPTLVWERPTGSTAVTLRLEGATSSARALAIAESVR